MAEAAAQPTNEYFAAAASDRIGAAVSGRIAEIAVDFDFSDTSETVYQHLFGESLKLGSQTQVVRKGEQAQLIQVRVNDAKALLESVVGMMLQAPMTWRATASNSDVESRGAVLLGQNLADSQWKRGGMGKFCGESIKAGIGFRSTLAFGEWKKMLGSPIGTQPTEAPIAPAPEKVPPDAPAAEAAPLAEEPVFEGDLRWRHILPWDFFYDTEYRSWEETPWVAVRVYDNKWDVVAEFPKTLPQGGEKEGGDTLALLVGKDAWLPAKTRQMTRATSHDVVAVWHFLHRKTPSVPNGRHVIMCGPACVLADGPLELPKIPIARFAPGERVDSAVGDSQWQSVLGVQEMTDSVESAVASNLDALGTQIVAMSEGTNTSEDDLNGLKLFKLPPSGQPPVGINLHKPAPGAAEWLKQKKSDKRDLVGLNDVSQGQPETAQMNAAAFALLDAAAVRRLGQMQRRAYDFIGEVGTLTMMFFAKYVTEERAVEVAGRAAKIGYPGKTWTGSKLKPLESLYVEVGNPLEQSVSGRIQIFQLLQGAAKDAGQPLSPEDAQQILETGRLEQATKPERDESLLVDWENDEMAAGTTPQVHWAENHLHHCSKHRSVMLTPAAKTDPSVATAFEEHVMWHYREFYRLPEGMDPRTDPLFGDRIRVLLGQTAPGQVGPPPPGPPPGMDGGTGPGGGSPPPPPALAPPDSGDPNQQQLPMPVAA